MIYHGDCLDILPTLGANSVDFVCADMPYGTTQARWDSKIDLDKLWPELIRVAKPTAAIALFAQTPFDKVLGASNLPMLKYEWIYEKTNATGHLNAKKMPMKAHENILVFYKKLPTYNPQKTFGHKRKTSRRSCNSELYGKQSESSYDSTERYPRSIQKFSSDKYNCSLHATQKPVLLCEYLIKTYTNENDVCLDFCMGSGSLGIATANTNRRFVGIEKDIKNFEIAKERLGCEVAA